MSISNVLYIQIEVANFPIIKDFLNFPMLHIEKDLELRAWFCAHLQLLPGRGELQKVDLVDWEPAEAMS